VREKSRTQARGSADDEFRSSTRHKRRKKRAARQLYLFGRRRRFVSVKSKRPW
jgi:hypothetical protein